MKFDSSSDYHKITNRFKNLRSSARSLKNTVAGLSKQQNSLLFKTIITLPEQDKHELIKALILGDGEKVNQLFLELPRNNSKYSLASLVWASYKGNSSSTSNFNRLTEHDRKDTFYLNNTTKSLIRCLLTNKRGISPAFTLRKVIQSLPESELGLIAKRAILQEIDSHASLSIPDPSFSSELPSRKDSFFSKKIDSHKLSQLLNLPLDKSEFVLLIRTYIAQQSKTLSVTKLITELDYNYTTLQYDNCLNQIKKFFLENNTLPLQSNILAKVEQVLPVTIEKNDARRYFEMKWSQFYFGQQASHKEALLWPVMQHFNKKYNIGTVLSKNDSQKIDDIKANLTSISEMEDLTSKLVLFKERLLKMRSEKYQLKGRELKEEKLILSNQYSIMRANSPYYPDEFSTISQANRSPDMHRSTDEKKWPRQHSDVAFVGSLSGHIYFLAIALKSYMKEHKNEPDLTKQVNEFFQAIMATYVIKGFHSMHEIIEVLDESPIRKLFAKYGVKLNLALNQLVISQAIEYATQYTVDIRSKELVHNELLSKSSLTEKLPLEETKNNTFSTHNYSKQRIVTLDQVKKIAKNYRYIKNQKFFFTMSPETKDVLTKINGKNLTDEHRYMILQQYMSTPSNINRDFQKVVELVLGKEFFAEEIVSIENVQSFKT